MMHRKLETGGKNAPSFIFRMIGSEIFTQKERVHITVTA